MGQYIYLERMDIRYDHQNLFLNRYIKDRLKDLSEIEGIGRIKSYLTTDKSSPKYMTLYEIATPELLVSSSWLAIEEQRQWLALLQTYSMNHKNIVLKWIGSAHKLLLNTGYLHFAMADVESSKESTFNQLYDSQHSPFMCTLPEVQQCSRYLTLANIHPRYTAIYEINDRNVPNTAQWQEAADKGEWKSTIRPYTFNRHFVTYTEITI